MKTQLLNSDVYLDTKKMAELATDNATVVWKLLVWQHLNYFGHDLNLAVQKGLLRLRISIKLILLVLPLIVLKGNIFLIYIK